MATHTQPTQQAQALSLKNRIEKVSADILAQDGQAYKEEILSAQVTGNGQGEVIWSHVDSKQYSDSSYGRSAESGYLMEKEVKDGVTVYRQRYYDPMGTNNSKSEVRFDAAGEVVGFKHKEFAATWGEAVKDVFTSPAGPGSLGYALAGSAWPGLVTAGAAAAGMAYYKTRPW